MGNDGFLMTRKGDQVNEWTGKRHYMPEAANYSGGDYNNFHSVLIWSSTTRKGRGTCGAVF